MISAAFPYQKQRRRVLGREMAYVEVGQGDPIVLLHGNPTSSYLWRNVLPYVQPRCRCIAPDLIGMGDSDKLPDSGPGSYRFVEHRRYLDALLDALDVHERVTLVVHDWGSALGFDWANRHREAVKGIAYMEAIVRPWYHWDQLGPGPRSVWQTLRSQAGEAMILRDNFFVERVLPERVLRPLSGEERKPAASMTDVNLTVGFSCSNEFSKVFRKATGFTPRAYHRPWKHSEDSGGLAQSQSWLPSTKVRGKFMLTSTPIARISPMLDWFGR